MKHSPFDDTDTCTINNTPTCIFAHRRRSAEDENPACNANRPRVLVPLRMTRNETPKNCLQKPFLQSMTENLSSANTPFYGAISKNLRLREIVDKDKFVFFFF
jgi:hypothetical protein